MEATPRFELGVKALQASALPLGHVARRFRQEKGRPNFFSIAGLLTIDGADDGVRTRDPDLGKVVLYQLSHVRMGNAFQFSNCPPRKGSEWRRRPDSNRG